MHGRHHPGYGRRVFIGSHLVEALIHRGYAVRILDDLSTGHLDNLRHLPSRPELIQASVTDPDALDQALRNVRIVFHLAALASVARSIEHPAATHHACATGTLLLLDHARRHRVQRLVYAASSSAYGGLQGADQTQSESLPVQPKSPYAAAKLAGELYLQAFAHSFGLQAVALRFFNIFGPRQRADSPYSGVIPLFIAAMLQHQPPTIYGDGTQSRDFTYVENAVQALLRAAFTPSLPAPTYNVGTGRSISILQLVDALNRILGTHLLPRFAPPRPGDVRYSCADIRRIQKDLGYQPTVSFEEGLERTVHWFRSSA
ncbi:MAG: NAD-dependent epimerase/dehydratase family protein [Thermogemmata sp.]